MKLFIRYTIAVIICTLIVAGVDWVNDWAFSKGEVIILLWILFFHVTRDYK